MSYSPQYELRFPQRDESGVAQDDELCELVLDDATEKIRFHDYAALYRRPGLYEQIFDAELECVSPAVVVELLSHELGRLNGTGLRVLDVGAGNGMVGAQLRAAGAEYLIGCDILPEAKQAAERDRPGLYDHYLAADLTALSESDTELLRSARLNALSIVAALGFGDIPPEVFVAAYGFIAPGGLIAFNLKDDFTEAGDSTGYSRLLNRAKSDGALEIVAREPYRHRLSVTGEPLQYVAFIAVKHGELDLDSAN